MKKAIMICIVVVFAIAGVSRYVNWCSRPDNGIHGIGKHVALIEGECVVINWDATEHEAELALRKWQELKK